MGEVYLLASENGSIINCWSRINGQ